MAQSRISQTAPTLALSASNRRFTRASWRMFACLLGFSLLCAVLSAWLLAQPGDGCQLRVNAASPRPIQACWGSWPTPLRPGDQVVTVDGVSLGGGNDDVALHALTAPPNWRDGAIVTYTVLRNDAVLHLPVPLSRLGTFDILHVFGAALVNQLQNFILPIFLGSLVIVILAPHSDAARLLLLASGPLFVMTTFVSAADTVSMQFVAVPVWMTVQTLSTLWGWLFVPTLLLFVLSFPRRVWPLSRWPHRTTVAIYGLPVAAWVFTLISGWGGPYIALLGLGALMVVGCAGGIALHTALRVRDLVLRAQTAWMALGVGAGFAFMPLFWLLTVFVPSFNDALGRLPGWSEAAFNLGIGLAFPLSMGIAITRYRLFDIDIVINRALVYGTLTAFVAGMYIGIVSYFGTLLQLQPSDLSPLIATAVVAVLFQPLRERVQRGVNRLMYGRRDEPYAVLARLGQQLEDTLAIDDLLPIIAETVVRALKLPYAAISLLHRHSMDLVAEYPPKHMVTIIHTETYTLPLIAQGETVGWLQLALRPGEHALSSADIRLLNDLSRQAGIAVQAARLTSDLRHLSIDLQQSRERLVTAREEERRRLRRDLHDGLGPALASVTLKVDAARNLLPRNPAKADLLLQGVVEHMQTTIADIRRLVYDLRPPALDQLGLVAALRQHIAQLDTSTQMVVQSPDHVPPLPAAVEVAAYRIALEAMTNVLRHAAANHCVVSITLEDAALTLDVRDDGCGIPTYHASGVGLRSMHERAAELGGVCTIETLATGGTRVSAHLPLAATERQESEQAHDSYSYR